MNQDRNKGQSGRINIQNNDNKRNIRGNNNNRHGSDRQHRLLLCDLFFTVIILLEIGKNFKSLVKNNTEGMV